jgi:hypothetical protein
MGTDPSVYRFQYQIDDSRSCGRKSTSFLTPAFNLAPRFLRPPLLFFYPLPLRARRSRRSSLALRRLRLS